MRQTTLAVTGLLLALGVGPGDAQTHGTITGRVTAQATGGPLRGVRVTVETTGQTGVTDADGRFRIPEVPAGSHTLVFRFLGLLPIRQSVTLSSGGTLEANAALSSEPIPLGEIVVTGASRSPERIVESPAAVSVVDMAVAEDLATTGQGPRAVMGLTGVDVVQNGINDFNVNARGFNSSLNQRILVLQDGRDLSFAFLGAQEWAALPLPLEDIAAIEIVRGPGSALYGANAYNGVLNIVTPSAREVTGTRLSLSGGELSTFRGDLRHAGVTSDGRIGYRVNVGFYRSDTWARSRTSPTDLTDEYRDAIDLTMYPATPPGPGFEVVPLAGQTAPAIPGPATGDRSAVRTANVAGRFDYYVPTGAQFTVESGASQVENGVFITPIGRVQVDKAYRPWARVAFTSGRFFAGAWYTGRITDDPQISLASGQPIDEVSAITQAELQYKQDLLDGRGALILGVSARASAVDTKGSLIAPADEDRTDGWYSAYGQVEFEPSEQVRLVGAFRFDDGNLISAQFSPKVALVVQPTDQHSIRFTVNRAFQTANTLQYFLFTPAGPPADFSALEAGLRASPLGPALAGVPDGELFTNSSAVPVLGLGNQDLDVEKVTSFEVGYKGQIANRAFVTLDVFYSLLSDFVTGLLPGANPALGAWTAPDAVPTAARAALEQAVRDQLIASGSAFAAAALTRLPDGSTAIAVSPGNAGSADEWGVEAGVGIQLTSELQAEANYTYFGFDIDDTSLIPGDNVEPNTPRHKANVALAYRGRSGFDARVAARHVDGHDFSDGVWVGRVPSLQTVDLTAGYQVNDNLRLTLIGTNILDQRRYQIFGGSLVGRRVLGGATVTF